MSNIFTEEYRNEVLFSGNKLSEKKTQKLFWQCCWIQLYKLYDYLIIQLLLLLLLLLLLFYF